MPLLLVALALPFAELVALVLVAQWIGVWWALGLLVLASVLGAALLRSTGRRTLTEVRAASRAGRVPAREAVDGALRLLGALLLLLPGLITGLPGLLLLLPPVQALARRGLGAWAVRSVTTTGAGQFAGRFGGTVVAGEVVDPPAGATAARPDSGSDSGRAPRQEGRELGR